MLEEAPKYLAYLQAVASKFLSQVEPTNRSGQLSEKNATRGSSINAKYDTCQVAWVPVHDST